MKKLVTSLALSCLLSGSALAAEKAHWGYTGEEGPAHWGGLSADYHICGAGKNQSPINLTGFIESELAPITINYSSPASVVLNNGHTIQANFPGGDGITVDGTTFELKQVHFHTPSENHINGESFPMEAHFVHADANGNLAVISVMFTEGEENAAIAKLWSQAPENASEMNALKSQMVGSELLPIDRDYYRFNGSLTTPPCSEGVRWLVMKNSLEVSAEQVETFSHLMHHPNNRPIQATNARPVLQ